MSHPSFALQAAIVTILRNDAALVALLGGPHIYESVPGDVSPPWIVFDEVTARTNDDSGGPGHLHRMILHCVSDQPGVQQCSALAAHAAALLHDATLTLSGHRLINLAVAEQNLRRIARKPYRIMALRLRAVTETEN